ncbi:TonB-dependent receptor plug domain-containing protein [Asticcacaulis sp. W401b]|uniref:TonB-dependent receptor plug domain-containing protein n=1 Tax=Asticcacaulis sp. W401b TaxID=3388666 RepID=UPI00397108BD
MSRPSRIRSAILRSTAVVCTTCLSPFVAFADEEPTEVVVSGKRQNIEARKDSTIAKKVYSEAEIERYGDATVGDVLKRLPGVSFTGPAGVAKDARLRGLDKGYTQYLINGQPVPATNQERQMQVDRLPADMIERIEIIQAPSAEYNSESVGGIINIVLKKSAADQVRLRAGYGRNGDIDVGDVIAQWSHTFDHFDVVMPFSYTVGGEDVIEDKKTLNAAGVVTQREYKPKPVQKTELLFAPIITWKSGDDRLSVSPFITSGTEEKDERATVYNSNGIVTKTTAALENKTDEIARLEVDYKDKTSWGELSYTFGYQSGLGDKDKYAEEKNATGVVSKRSQEFEKIEETQGYGSVRLTRKLGETHVIKAGTELRSGDYQKRKTTYEAASLAAALVQKSPGQNDLYQITEKRKAAYLQDEWHFAKTHWLTAGIRYEAADRIATDRNGLRSTGSFDAFNPSVHYKWQISPDLVLRSSAARTQKLPKFDNVNPLIVLATGNGAGTINNPDKAGNADLRPEVSTGLEFGLDKFLKNDRGYFGLNLYHREVEDFVEKVSHLEGARYVQRPFNVGTATFWGAELDWNVPVLREGKNKLSLTGNHSEMRGEVSNTNAKSVNDVKDMPPRITNLGLDWVNRPIRMSAGLQVNYTPEYTTRSLNDDGVLEVKTRNEATMVDFYISHTVARRTELRLIAKNILSIEKAEYNAKYKSDGSINTIEDKVETSVPMIMLTVEKIF